MARCALSCAEQHTYRYQSCALAPPPEPTVSILRVEDGPDGERHIATRSIPLTAWEALVKVAMWVSRGRSFALDADPDIYPTYPDAAARRALGALHDSGLLPMGSDQRGQQIVHTPALPELLARVTAERDEARQHAAAIAAQRDRLRQRMNNLADRWDLEGPPPGNRVLTELRAEISCDPFHPEASLVVQQYRADDGSQKWAFRCWGTDTCDGWLSLDNSSQQWAERARDRHVAEKHQAESAPGPARTEETDTTKEN